MLIKQMKSDNFNMYGFKDIINFWQYEPCIYLQK